MLGQATRTRLGRAAALALLACLAAPAPLAHDGVHPASGWNTDWHVWAGLILIGAVYAVGVRRLWTRAGAGAGISRRQAGAYAAGWLVLVAALLSPIDALAEHLASAHMVQHLLLMLVAAPLLVYGAPAFAALWALPPRWRAPLAQRWRRALGIGSAWQALSQPLLAWSVYFVVLWGWHVPFLYEAALAHPLLHDLQHLLFVGAAGLLWWAVLDPMGRLRPASGAGVMYLFMTALHAMALGVFLTLSPSAWYPTYVATAPALGLAPLADQQIAGALMWMPACLVYVILAALIFGAWLRDSERASARMERIAAAPSARGVEVERLLGVAVEHEPEG